MESYKLVVFLAVGIALCYAKVEGGSDANSVNLSEKSVNSTAAVEKISAQSPLFSTDLSWKNGFGTALVIAGAALCTFAVLGGLSLLISPLFGYKFCSILGNCDNGATTYSGQPNSIPYYGENSAYNTYNNPYSTYRKRSVEYIKPIIETLAKAYEKSS